MFRTFSLLFPQLIIFLIFIPAVRPDYLPHSDLRIRPWNQTTTAVHKIRPRSDHHTSQSDEPQIPTTDQTMHQLPHQTIVRPDYQNQPIRSDHHRQTRPPDQISPTGYHSWLLHFKSAQQTQPREMVQVRCIVCGLGQGGYIELWMNLAKHTFHTRSALSFRTSFPA